MTMPAGKYYVGDLCYVMHEDWNEVCELFFKGRTDHSCNEGEFTLKDGRRFVSYNTAWGDGEYYDQSGHSYSVDAGLIGCILVKDIDETNPGNFLTGGQIKEFTSGFDTYYDEGKIVIGDIIIDTDPCEETEEDECYQEW